MLVSDRTFEYCLAHSSVHDPLLEALERETHLRTLSPQMISGPYQGALLRMLSQMIRPQHILEVGTFTGYTTICLSAGLAPGGMLHTIEVNDELGWIIRKFLDRAGISQQVTLHLGDAATVIPTLEECFDMVFLDAGKLDYESHYELALSKTRPGGFLLADNVLWDGKVAAGDTKDETATVLRHFNQKVHQDERVDNLLLPVRDGIMMMRKRHL
ncbi:MAG TPA: O-methyltransferase [Saprospiraceae bacterium]|nr:O-methyltransferase [Saprospiraceae bacterium]